MRRALAIALALAPLGCNAVFGVEAGQLDAGMAHVAAKGKSFSFKLEDIVLMDKSERTLALDHDFAIDLDEVTVGAFAAWAKTQELPDDGEELDPGGPYAGAIVWDKAWNGDALDDHYSNAKRCHGGFNYPAGALADTFVLDRPNFPMTCVNWYQAVAFCHQQGKRLPTNLEWQYVAQGGASSDPLPFAGDPGNLSCDEVIFDPDGKACGFPKEVGTATGVSRDGLKDLAGSVVEWVWDGAGPIPDDGTWSGQPGAPTRIARGGAYYSAATETPGVIAIDTVNSQYLSDPPSDQTPDAGFRCARSLAE